MSFTRKKDKKVEVSFTNWVLGASLLSLTSTESDRDRRRSASKRVIITEVESDDDAVLIKSPETPKADRKEKEKEKTKGGEKGDEKSKSKVKNEEKDKGEKKDKDKEKKPQTCNKCGKKVVPCAEGCKGRTCSEGHQSKSKFDSKGNSKKDGSEKSDTESGKDGVGEGNGWTEQQDSKIKEMKGENKSWKDIALEVGASKNDVQNRYKELMKGAAGEKKDESKNENGRENGVGSAWGGDEIDNSGESMIDLGVLFVDDVEDGGGGEQSERDNKSNNSSGGNGGGGGKKQKHKNSQQNNSSNGGRGLNSQRGSPGGFVNPFDDPPEQVPTAKLRAEGAWTQDDCEILEYLKSKYEENKWLHMQAGFYNWTGRMVIAQLIEKKFKDDGAA